MSTQAETIDLELQPEDNERLAALREIMDLNLTPDEGFLLSQIDGSVSIEQLLNLSNDRVRTLEVIAKFIREGLVE